MDGIRNAQDIVGPWWAYFDYCFSANPLSTVCGPFWERIILAVVIGGLIATAYGALKYFAYRRRDRRARIAEWEREQSDEVGIKEATWNGDKAYQAELPDAEVAARIRAALDERKRMTAPRSDA